MILQQHFLRQAEACEALGSPFNALLLRVLAQHLNEEGEAMRRLRDWPEDRIAPDAVALRLAGGLHALVLSGKAPELASIYGDAGVAAESLWPVLAPALQHHEAHLMQWLDSAPQTNELRRAPAMILAASLACQQFPDLPLRVSELGASAGLNLLFDRFALQLPQQLLQPQGAVLTLRPDWQGVPPRVMPFEIADRRGVDLNPLNPGEPQDVLRLRSYLWPDQPERHRLTDAALAIAPARVDRGDAGDWLQNRLQAPVPGCIDFVYHTIAWQYFPEATKAACRAALARAAERASPDHPLAYLTFEMDDAGSDGPGAPVVLQLWPGNTRIELGRMDFHGRWFHLA